MTTPKKNTKRILVGIDYTKSSNNALEYAIGMARLSKSGLVLFHVYDFPVLHTNAGLYMIDYRAIKRDDIFKLEQLKAKTLEKHHSLDIEILNSNMAFQTYVQELVRKKKIQSVVLGLETKNKISKFLWGTTGLEVAGKIDCPVLIVPENYTYHMYGKMVATVDYQQELKPSVIRKAKDFAKAHHMKCELMHVQTDDELTFGLDAGLHKKDAVKKGIQVVEAKTFAEGVRKYVGKHKSDMVVLFSRKHSVAYRLFNETNTKAVAFDSKVPVMAIHA